MNTHFCYHVRNDHWENCLLQTEGGKGLMWEQLKKTQNITISCNYKNIHFTWICTIAGAVAGSKRGKTFNRSGIHKCTKSWWTGDALIINDIF